MGAGRLRRHLPLMVFVTCINTKVTGVHSYWQCLEEEDQRRECISGFVFWLVDMTLPMQGVAVRGPKTGVAVSSACAHCGKGPGLVLAGDFQV